MNAALFNFHFPKSSSQAHGYGYRPGATGCGVILSLAVLCAPHTWPAAVPPSVLQHNERRVNQAAQANPLDAGSALRPRSEPDRSKGDAARSTAEQIQSVSETATAQAAASPICALLGRTCQPEGGSKRDHVKVILRSFLSRTSAEPEIARFLINENLTLQYTVSDLDLEFYIGPENGRLVGQFGRPLQPAPVRFASDAATLDGVLRGALNYRKASPDVHLSLLRQVHLAKGISRAFKVMSRLYNEADDELTVTEMAGYTR